MLRSARALEKDGNCVIAMSLEGLTHESEIERVAGLETGQDEGGNHFLYCPSCFNAGKRTGKFSCGQPLRTLKHSVKLHLLSTNHKSNVEKIAAGRQRLLHHRQIGINLGRLSLQTIREGGSYAQFEGKVLDFHLSGGLVGDINHSKAFMRDMVKSYHATTITNIKDFLHEIDPVTKQARVFAGNADKVTELHRTGQAMGVLFFEEGKIKSAFHDYRLLNGHTGKCLMDDFYEGSLMGTLGFRREQLRQQFTSFAVDGQYILLNCSEHLAKHQLRVDGDGDEATQEDIEKTKQWLLVNWDKAHQMELAIKDTRVDRVGISIDGDGVCGGLPSVSWYQPMAKDISAIISRFNYGKSYEAMLSMASDLGIKFYQLQRFCETRFAQSEQKVYASFMKDWLAVLRLMKVALVNADAESKPVLIDQVGKMIDFYWVANVITLADLLGLCMGVSLRMQTVNVLPWEVVEVEEKFIATLKYIKNELEAERDFPQEHFPFLHGSAEIPAKGRATPNHPGTRLDHLKSGKFMGEELCLDRIELDDGVEDLFDFPGESEEERAQRNKGRAIRQGLINVGHDVSDWCENLIHFFNTRYEGSALKSKVKVMAKCVDLRLFVIPMVVPYASFDIYLECCVKPNLEDLYDWAVGGGINMPEFNVVWSQCMALGMKMHEDVARFTPSIDTPRHRWYCRRDGDNIDTVRLGTEIQQEILTKSEWYDLAPAYLYLYQHMALKSFCEAVVEGMCSVVAKHATGVRSLCFDMYAKESIVDYNAPDRTQSNAFITKALDHLFASKAYKQVKLPAGSRGWRFFTSLGNQWRADKRSNLSTMLTNRIEKGKSGSRLKFMDR
jgi:hypothetical protein